MSRYKIQIGFELGNKIIDFYKENKSLNRTSEQFNIKNGTLYRFLKERGVDTRKDTVDMANKIRKFDIDGSFFKHIDTRDKAYILGILYADGAMNDSGNLRQVRLKLIDIDLLEDINTKLNYSKPLITNKPNRNPCFKTERPTKSLMIVNQQIFNDLVSHGCTPRKSFTKTFPTHIDDSLMNDFIRGYFDGNGCVGFHVSKTGNLIWEIKIVSSAFFCEGAQKYLSSIGIHTNIDKDKRTDERISNLRIRRVSDVRSFLEYTYSNIDGQLYLKRKYNKYLQLINGNVYA